MYGRLRRLGAALAVAAVASVTVAANPAEAAACTGQRSVSIAGSRVVEGSTRGAFTPMAFTISSTGCAQAGSVRFTTTPFTASTADYVTRTASVTFRAGDASSQSVIVQVVQDVLPESTECPIGGIVAPTTNVRIVVAQALGKIVDDDAKLAAGGFHCSE